MLADDWLNNGPASLAELLPNGWPERLTLVFQVEAITLRCLGRLDLLRSKLFSLCDRATHLGDCLALAPSVSELQEIEPWIAEQHGNPEWQTHVRDVMRDLSERLRHGV